MAMQGKGAQILPDNTDHTVRLNAPAELHPFMRLVLSNPALQARLATILQPEIFESEAINIAAQYDTPLPADALKSLFRPNPLGLSRWEAAPVELTGWAGDGWIPTRSTELNGAPAFDWSWLGDAKTDDPFFEDSVRQANGLPFNILFRTRGSLESLIAGKDSAETVPLSGFIFHMSRCGSTLLRRMLGALPNHLVVSEAEPLDKVIKWAEASDAPHESKLEAIRAIVAALSRKRNPIWQRFFIKCDAWHILSFRLLRDAFPDVPWIFLHREPVEVLMSLAAQPGMQAIPGMLPDSVVKIDNVHAMPPDEYGATLLARLCEAAIKYSQDDAGMIVDYTQLPDVALDTIPQHFGFVPDERERAIMRDASKGHSKNPSEAFSPDSTNKQDMASERMRALADCHLRRLHEKLKQAGSRASH